jgi:hypothetical protein
LSKFSDSNYDILKEYFDFIGSGAGTASDSWIWGIKKALISDGGIATTLYEDNEDFGFVPYSFIIQEIDGNKFKMLYDGNLATHSINGIAVSAAIFEVGNDMYFRKDGNFYEYLLENVDQFRNFINTNRTFCFFGKIWPISGEEDIWNIEFEGMKDYMESALPDVNRTTNLVELIKVWFDQVNHEPYNMTKYLWALLDAKEIDSRWLGYIASMYGILINEDIDDAVLREWVDLLVYFLKRVGTYDALYVVYDIFSGGSVNAMNIYERWQEWCQSGAGDIPPFKEFPGFAPGVNDFNWLEFYNVSPSGGAGKAWYDQFIPSGAPVPNPYSIDMNPYPNLALEAPSAGCDIGSATPSGSMVITPHYITEIDLTTEPIGDKFNEDWILNKFYIDEFIRNWEYVRPVGKYVQYQELISPASIQSRTGETESLYPLTSLGYFNTTFTGSQFLSAAKPTPNAGQFAIVYTQYNASTTWTITHEFGTNIMVQAWKPTTEVSFLPMERVVPSNIEILTDNIVRLTFDEAISGIACIAGYYKPEMSFEYDQVAPNSTWTIIHGLETAAPSGYPVPARTLANFWTSPSKSWPLSASIVDGDRTEAIWSTNQTGEALVRTADYNYTQAVASTTWTINHDTGTDGMIIQTYDSNGNYINPISVTLPNRSTAVVEFGTAQSGEAYFIWFEPVVVARTSNDCDITKLGICPDGLGYWKVGNGTTVEYNPYSFNDVESVTASGDYWRVWQDTENYYIDFIVPIGEELTIREVGLFNVNDDLMYYSRCSELHKPIEVQTVFHYRTQALFVTESSSSSSWSSSSSSSSWSSSSASSSSWSSSSVSSSSSNTVQVLQCNFDPNDDFTGPNGSFPDSDRWTRVVTGSGICQIDSDTLRMFSDPFTSSATLTNNAKFQDDVSLEIDYAHGSSDVKQPLNFYIEVKNQSNNYWVRLNRGYTSQVHSIYITEYNGSVLETYRDSNADYISGIVRFVRTGNTLEVWVDQGDGSGFVLRSTMSDFGSGDIVFKIVLPLLPNFQFNTWFFDNFTLNAGIMSCSSSSTSSSSSCEGQGEIVLKDSDTRGGGTYSDVWFDGTYIYVTALAAGLRTYTVDEVSGVLTHVDVHFESGKGQYEGVWGDGNYIYVASGSTGLLSYSVDGAGILTYVDSIDDGDTYYGVWGDGTFVYAANYFDGIRSYSVDGAGAFTFKDQHFIGVGQYYDVWGDGNFIYCAARAGGVVSYSVDGSGNLTWIDTDKQGGGSSPYRGVWGDGNFLYISNVNEGLMTYSVDGAGNLTYITSLADVGGDEVWGDGTFVYTTEGGLNSIIVNGSGFPTLLDTDTTFDTALRGVYGDGKYVFGCAHNISGKLGSFEVNDCT